MLAGFGIPHGIPPNEWYLSEPTNLTRAGATDFELEGQLVQEKGPLAEGALF